MATTAVFEKAFPYGDDVLALPVADLDAAAKWYAEHFALVEVERRSEPQPTVIMERDGARFGFSVNGGDSSQEGAAILVSDIHAARTELESRGVKSETGAWTNGTARNFRSSSSRHPTGFATTSTSRLRASRRPRAQVGSQRPSQSSAAARCSSVTLWATPAATRIFSRSRAPAAGVGGARRRRRRGGRRRAGSWGRARR